LFSVIVRVKLIKNNTKNHEPSEFIANLR